MSQTNDKKQVPNIDKKVERPKVDSPSLEKSIKEKQHIISNNETVKK